jgi:hypothetical protein
VKPNLLALLGLSFAACSTPQVASVASWQVEEFEVRATDVDVGEQVVAGLPAALRALKLLPGLRDARPGRIDVVPFGPSDLLGLTRIPPEKPTDEAEILIASDAFEIYLLDERVAATVAHELTHFSLGPVWRALPAVLEEGLCDWVATRAAPSNAPENRLCTALDLGPLIAGEDAVSVDFNDESIVIVLCPDIDFSGGSLSEVPEMLALNRGALLASRWRDRAAELYSLGSLLVQCIGVTRLHELCIEAREQGDELLSPQVILEAAGLPIERPDLWWAHVVAMTRAEERAGLAAWLGGKKDGVDVQIVSVR